MSDPIDGRDESTGDSEVVETRSQESSDEGIEERLDGRPGGDRNGDPPAGSPARGGPGDSPPREPIPGGEAVTVGCPDARRCSRTIKTAIEPVDPEAVLSGVESLTVSRWQYDSRPGATHMGPMAEEFIETFGLGDDPRRIHSVDADGVALASIQGLADRLGATRTTLATTRDQVEAIRSELAATRDELGAVREALERRDDRMAERRERIATLEQAVERRDDRIDEQSRQIDDLQRRLATLEGRVDLPDETPQGGD